ncbi:hypothetical protein [Actinoplanes subglobosus]|uniref:Uncharacterized protein n=1 Tax=Actinoplanes subglobosus TaxID=1547892 RepID=A0ABV8ITN3_9ACTN
MTVGERAMQKAKAEARGAPGKGARKAKRREGRPERATARKAKRREGRPERATARKARAKEGAVKARGRGVRGRARTATR